MSGLKANPFHVVYLGENGFPHGFGAMQKLIMVSRALLHSGARVTVLNRKGVFDPDQALALPLDGEIQGIHYHYLSRTIYRPKSFWRRNWRKLRGSFGEWRYLKNLKKEGQLQGAIVSSHSFVHVLLYRLYGWYLDFPLVLNHVEMLSALQHRQAPEKRINDFLYERFLIPSLDGALPISAILEKDFADKAPGKPMLKVPVICDFERFALRKSAHPQPVFLYCGAIAYGEVIDFILDAFARLPADRSAELHLLIGHSDPGQFEALQRRIQSYARSGRVRLWANVPPEEIPGHFVNADALLIPLRPTLQDAARFPHKIGEYLAAANPMITTDCGEITHYFEDGQTALIAADYDPAVYAAKMQYVLDHPEAARKIGQQGYALGLAQFNYLSYGPRLRSFLESLPRRQAHPIRSRPMTSKYKSP